MGSYTFTWEHDATEVFVTGTFDDWKKTVQLEKKDGIFQKTVELPKTKTQYKFVVDGNWCTNDTAPKEDDGKGIVNNVLTPDDIKEPAAGAATISSAAPESTTAALASQVPKESDKPKSEESLPGAFPLTPPTETPSTEPQLFSVNPIPATDTPGNPIKLAPGEPVPDPSTLTSNTIQSTVKDDKEPEKEQTFGVAPIPAGETAGNPIKLAPGEPVPDPSTLTSNTVDSTVKTDAASYEKSDALPPQLGPVVTPEAERAANGGMFGLPPLTGPLIPESSLPKDVEAKTEQDPGVTIQSAAPTSTTAALAGQVPLESAAVPEAVKASQEEAGFTPEASANPEAVEEKKEVEQELKDKVPEQPAATESSTNTNVTETVAAGATAAAGAFAAATYAAKDKAAETIGLNGQATASDVPAVVAESQKEAHVSPEAAANPEAVEEKKQVEAELVQEVSKAGETTETAASEVPAVVAESQKEAHVSPEAAANPVAVEEKKEVEAELVKEVNKAGETTAADVPAVVTKSQRKADASPEATANPEAVEEKKEVEAELLKEVKKTDEAAEPAPVVTAATAEIAPATASSGDALNAPAAAPAQPETSKPAADSRDVSPMSKPATKEQTQPTVTTGAETSKTEAKSTPETTAESSKGQEESVASSAAADKKKKRRSFFGKLKDKLSSKS